MLLHWMLFLYQYILYTIYIKIFIHKRTLNVLKNLTFFFHKLIWQILSILMFDIDMHMDMYILRLLDSVH